MIRLVWLALVVACGSAHVEMRGSPSPGNAPGAPGDAGGASFALPAVGEAVGATLASGWPVWIVHHDDGTASVIDAVVAVPPGRRAGRPFFRHDAALVRWVPAMHRFVAGNLVYDERGHVLGYPVFDTCLDECPRIEDAPREQRDLDAFEARLDDAIVHAGARHAGDLRPVARTWVPWFRTDREGREADFALAGRPPVPAIAIADAAARAPGSYAIVEGGIVRATYTTPRVCRQGPACGACPASAPVVDGIAGDRANVPSIEARLGTFLVRREAASLAVIARIPTGECSGEAPRGEIAP